MPLPDPEGCASKLRVLSDPTRLEVMHLLGARPRAVKQLLEALDIEQSLLSHHLKVLRDAGLVRSRAEGQSRRYSIVSSRTHADTLDLGCCQLNFKRPSPPS